MKGNYLGSFITLVECIEFWIDDFFRSGRNLRGLYIHVVIKFLGGLCVGLGTSLGELYTGFVGASWIVHI